MIDIGSAIDGINHHHHQRQRDEQRELHLVDRGADGLRAVVEHLDVDRRRHFGAEGRQQRADLVDHPDGVRSRLAVNGEHDAALVLVPGGDLVVLHAVDDAAELLQAHRRAVPVGDDDRPERLRVLQLPGRLDGEHSLLAEERARGKVDVGGGDRGLDLVDPDAARRHGVRIDLYANGVLLLAEDEHLRDAVDGGDALGEIGLGILVHRRQRQSAGGESEKEHREIGRVHLAKGRRRRHGGRQLARGGGDGRIHVLCSGVNVAIEHKLQRDTRRALARHRAHLVDAGDGRELLLERRRNRRSHRLRAGAGQLGGHLDGRKIDVRQRRDRQQAVRGEAEDQDAGHHQHRHHRPTDPDFAEVHEASAPGFAICTRTFGPSRSCPRVTTRSPGCRPWATMARSPSVRFTAMRRSSAVSSAEMT